MRFAKDRFFPFALVGSLVLLIALLVQVRKDARRWGTDEDSPLREIRLAARTIVAKEGVKTFPSMFAAAQTPSSRGTIPFWVLAGEPVTKDVRARVVACGARVIGFVPENALVVEADAAALAKMRAESVIDSVYECLPTDKIHSRLAEQIAQNPAGSVTVSLLPLAAEDVSGVVARVRQRKGVVLAEATEGRKCVRATLPAAVIADFAAEGDVRWIEVFRPPHLLNNVAVKPGLMNVEPVRQTQGLTGAGQIITTTDSGLDTGATATLMADFRGQVCAIKRPYSICQYKDTVGHGTHTAGSLVGNGALSDGEIQGVAFGAQLYVWSCANAQGDIYMPEVAKMFQPDQARYPSYIHSASWGGDTNIYSTSCVEVDEWLWAHPETLAVFACGNDGKANAISEPAAAKNVLAVGASESLRPTGTYWSYADNPSAVSSFSSRGPMPDGRIKPDLCAPGAMILSTRSTQVAASVHGWGSYSNNYYMFDSGTSMATPLAAGSAALMREWLVTRRGFTNELPTAALMKAILTGGAHDMAGDPSASCGGQAPNNVQGWGRVDLGETLFPSNRTVQLFDRVPFVAGLMKTFRIRVTDEGPLDVQLAWVDYPGDPAAAKALVNDLDLVVSNETTGVVWLGNDTQHTGARDSLNTLESVRLAAAEPGIYTVGVRGTQVPYDSFEGGAAALYMRGALAEVETEVEMVTLHVAGEGAEQGDFSPGAGSYQYPKGTLVQLQAEAVLSSNAVGTVNVLRPVAGWRGTGDVPASGAEDRVSIFLNQESTITWQWAAERYFLLGRFSLIPSYGNYYWFEEGDWLQEGSTWQIEVPADAPEGLESFDLTSQRMFYWDDDGSRKRMSVQRLGRVELAETDGEWGEAVFDAAGRLPQTFSLTMDRPYDLLFSYWDVASTNLATGLPTWWYNRYLAGGSGDSSASADADGDGVSNRDEFAADTDPADAQSVFRILSISRTNLVWRGGRERMQVVERTPCLGKESAWLGIWTNSPPTEVQGECHLPTNDSRNFFYRIRAL